jgi:hypothetical protein
MHGRHHFAHRFAILHQQGQVTPFREWNIDFWYATTNQKASSKCSGPASCTLKPWQIHLPPALQRAGE